MTVRRILFALGFTTLGAAMGTSGMALAYGPRGGWEHRGFERGPFNRLEALVPDLDLTPAQRSDLEQARARLRQKARALSEDARTDLRAFVEDLAQSRVPDRDEVHAAISASFNARRDLALEASDVFLDFYQGLTNAQKKVIADRIQARLDEIRARRQQGDNDTAGPASE